MGHDKLKIVFRTEGSHKQGMGDVFGSIALAEAFKKETSAILFLVKDNKETKDVLNEKGFAFQVADRLDEETHILSEYQSDVVIINKLDNPPDYVKTLKQYASVLVTIDDAGEGAKHADLNINVLYPIEGSISDPSYITLREEFLNARQKERKIRQKVSKVLVTQGGSDTYGFTPKILSAIDKASDDFTVVAVIGPAFKHHKELDNVLARMQKKVDVLYNVKNFSELMLQMDLAITAGGITMFELSCLGVPSIVVCGERFEVATAERLESYGVVLNLGFGYDVEGYSITSAVESSVKNFALREEMSKKGRALIDGRGCERIAKLISDEFEKIRVG